MKIVLDTSVVAKFFLAEEKADIAHRLLAAIGNQKFEAHVPSLIWEELANVLVKTLDDPEDVTRHIETFEALAETEFLTVHDSTSQTRRRSVQLAFTDTKGQGHVSLYDATFHALALELGAIFVTDDKRHIRKTETEIGSVQLFDDLNF